MNNEKDNHMVDEPMPPPNENNPPDDMNRRLERLGGEPAPIITPEEFARLHKSGANLHLIHRDRCAQRGATTLTMAEYPYENGEPGTAWVDSIAIKRNRTRGSVQGTHMLMNAIGSIHFVEAQLKMKMRTTASAGATG
jgi:hypothetical protein